MAGLIFTASLQGQQSPGQQSQSPQGAQPAAAKGQTQGQSGLLEIYQIDLEPTGATFAIGQPKLEGNVYVYTAYPERATGRLPQARVKKITRRTKDLSRSTWSPPAE
jgi:phage-related protein